MEFFILLVILKSIQLVFIYFVCTLSESLKNFCPPEISEEMDIVPVLKLKSTFMWSFNQSVLLVLLP